MPGKHIQMTEKTDVAVIMPTYNGELFVEKQVLSILNQTYSDFILYIVDDCSMDGTQKAIERLVEKDHRIRFSTNSYNKGVVKNVNDTLAEVEADIYFLADQDDIWLPDKMIRQIEVLKKDDVVMTFTNLLLIDENGRFSGKDFWSVQQIDPYKAQFFEFLALNSIVSGCSMAFKRKLLDMSLPISDKAIMHDYWLSFFAACSGEVVPLKETMVLYRQHKNNVEGAPQTLTQKILLRYQGCTSYRDFKKRKHQSFKKRLEMIRALNARLLNFGFESAVLDQYIAFYESLIEKRWLFALQVIFRIKRKYSLKSLAKSLAVAAFFPFLYFILMLKYKSKIARHSQKFIFPKIKYD